MVLAFLTAENADILADETIDRFVGTLADSRERSAASSAWDTGLLVVVVFTSHDAHPRRCGCIRRSDSECPLSRYRPWF